jgi:hypothetical protein
LTSSWDDTGAAVTVFDSSSLGPALNESDGVAWLNPDSGRWEIISLRSAGSLQFVVFRLTEALTRGANAGATPMNWDRRRVD